MPRTRTQKLIAKRWVAALRSNNWKQGKGALHVTSKRHGDRFCCLGVLCELAVKAKVIPPAKPYDGSSRTFMYGPNNVYGLPPAVRRWAGIKNHYGEFDMAASVRGKNDLAGLNDSDRVGFALIADLIENPPPGLFVD